MKNKEKEFLKELTSLTKEEAHLLTLLCQQSGVGRHTTTFTLSQSDKPTLKDLTRRYINVKSETGAQRLVPIFMEVTIGQEEATVKWSEPFYENLELLKEYSTLIGVRYIHAIDVYSLLKEVYPSPQDTVNKDVTIKEIRTACNCENKYVSFSQFRKKVLDSAIMGLNEQLNKKIDYTFIKNGKEVVALRFSLEKKNTKEDSENEVKIG